jgi:hypothetical protein
MENRESLDEVQNHVHNRLPPEQGCSTSADAPDRTIAWPRIHSSTVREKKRSRTPSGEACNWIVQLRGPGFTPQLSERRSVLRPLEKPATGSCKLRGPGFNPQLSERRSAHRLLEKPATGMQTERKKKQNKICGAEFTPRVSFGEKRRRYESSSSTRGEKRDRRGR